MELRQVRYFVRVAELGSMSRAALDLGVVQSALSQQISRLEGELSVRLLLRTRRGVSPTEAGLAFLREAQLILRHADQARRAAQRSRLTGTVSVGLAPTTAAVLAMPFLRAMRERYPDVGLHMVEGLSGHLAGMLDNRRLDFAVLFNVAARAGWRVTPLLDEKLYLIGSARNFPSWRDLAPIPVRRLQDVPLIMPTAGHGLRSVLEAAFASGGIEPRVVAEIDSLTMLMDAVDSGLGATVQPRSAVARFADAAERFAWTEIDGVAHRHASSLCSLLDEELSPAALGARHVLSDCARSLVQAGHWPSARVSDRDS